MVRMDYVVNERVYTEDLITSSGRLVRYGGAALVLADNGELVRVVYLRDDAIFHVPKEEVHRERRRLV